MTAGRGPGVARRAWSVVVSVIVVLVVATGCEIPVDLLPPATPTTPTAEAAQAELAELRTAPSGSMAGYSRDRFPHWSGQGDGCDTRAEVLRRDSAEVSSTSSCPIRTGEWFSPYDGETRTDASDIDIDHVVPLAAAWRAGASSWTEDQREEFANDLDGPSLIAVTATVNRSKGDQTPDQWRPPRTEFHCTYALMWVQTKSTWDLSVTMAERAALTSMLNGC